MNRDSRVRSHWGRCIHVACAAIALVAVMWASRETCFPLPVTTTSSPSVETIRCAACHSEIVAEFNRTPHRNALRLANDAVIHKLFEDVTQLHPVDVAGEKLFPAASNGLPVVFSPSMGNVVPLHWFFGSGKHARTPVTVWLNADGAVEVLEHRVSWYPDHGWGETLGLSSFHNRAVGGEQTAKTNAAANVRTVIGLESLGKVHDAAAARECFGCHTTHLPLTNDGRDFDWSRLVPGVSCERCHIGGERHVQAMERGMPETRLDHWHSLTPLESINRCGECHRRADHFTPDELVPENERLVRFASVGLSLSQCFLKQREAGADGPSSSGQSDRRFDCVSCHDPHRPAESDPQFYLKVCAKCHDNKIGGDAPPCAAQPKTSNCLTCHMPKVDVQPPLKFTDHWIRKRTEPDRAKR